MSIRRVAVLLLISSASSLARAEDPKAETVDLLWAAPETFSEQQRGHWAYQPPRRPEPPEVKQWGWVRNPIDRFLLSALEEAALPHAPEADRTALIRRVTFDLT